ncbi:tyrosine-type recombinase/integrase [Sandaracinus amylolyticus]|uniref:tyrosine-type recombinase/integrase n=1 Tax=Sandaracinus amylolyticus TaxID=927083 RepID=UPI001F1CB841|nr:site-specific integrase [Sandaracinus amylolyticus]
MKALDPKTGRTKDVIRIVEAKSAAEASAKRDDLRRTEEASSGARTRERLGDAATSWMRSKLPALRASTRRTYADVIDLHIVPRLGDYYVDAITPDDVVELRDEWSAQTVGEGESARPISPTTVNGRLRVLRQLLADITHDLGIRDPAARVPAVRVPKPKKRKGLEAHELRKVLEVLRRDYPQWYAITLTLALTAQRWGAVAALEWSQINDARGAILFDRAHVRGIVDEQKTGAEVEVPIVEILRTALAEHRRAQLEEQAPWLGRGLVFPSTTGTLMQPSSLRKPLAAACTKAGVPVISPHGLRYTFNHLAKKVTTGDVARSITGHVTEEMTTHYDWIGDREKQRAVAKVAALVHPTSRVARGSGSSGGSGRGRKNSAR